ncbi:MAG: hypothetical protein J6B10_08915 [Lachnospiraceae bacterium]|nr:hypothetical protein [Lachnospiraceae bacterium]
MYSNLLKAGWVVCNEQEKKVIDNNSLIARKLEELGGSVSTTTTGRQTGEEEPSFVQEESGADGLADALFADRDEGFQSGLDAPTVEIQEPVYEGPSPEELIAEAEKEAEMIRQTARGEAEQIRSLAREEGQNQGYQEGYQSGLARIQEMEAELVKKEEMLERRYQDKMRELEPQFVDTLNGIYERVFDVKFSEQRGLVLHLLTNAMRGIEETKDFILHVSPQDYREVREAKDILTSESLVGSATVEIIEDMTLGKNECLIETGGGIFDCSLGTELSQLQKELKLLSYEK